MKLNDKNNLRKFRDDFDEAVRALAQKHGVEIHLGNCTYSPDGGDARFALTLTEAGKDPNAVAFERHASVFGLKASDLGQEIEVTGKRYTIVGLKPRSRKNPIIVRGDRGHYVMPAAVVRNALAAKE